VKNSLTSKLLYFALKAITPLLALTIAFNFIILIGAIFFWRMPSNIYIPFMGGFIQMYFDRFLLIVGIMLALFSSDED
jgi:hypothetical protein